MSDKIDAAIAAQAQPMEERFQVPVTIADTGRQFVIDIPADMTDAEMVDMLGWIGTNLALHVRQRTRGPKSRIYVPGALQ